MHRDLALHWYATWMAESGFRASSIETRTAYTKTFISWLARHGIEDFTQVDRSIMENYAKYLLETVSLRSRKPYRPSTRGNLWRSAAGLLGALYETEHIKTQPVPNRLITVPYDPLPTILSEADIEHILELIDCTTHQGRRDRAIYELIYSAGLRVSEAVGLKWADVNLNERLAYIRQAKFDKDRMVPLTHEAVEMLKRFRATLEHTGGYVFEGLHGHVHTSSVNKRFKELARTAGVYRQGVTVHQLRHACATHLIAHGADIRYVQELLGHESIQTTVRYTHDQVEQVKRMYRSYHPRENQLYQEVDEEYRQRIETLKQRIIGGRQKHLAKLRRSGYDGDEYIFQRLAGQ